ncbi:hypothetical protein ACQP1W_40950 [Spirillospora sp. CA-255316]
MDGEARRERGRLVRRIFGEIGDEAVRALETAFFCAVMAAWILGAVLGGLFFGIAGFAVVASLALAHLVHLLVRAGRVHYARARAAGSPVTARGDFKEAAGCIGAIIGAAMIFALLLMLALA